MFTNARVIHLAAWAVAVATPSLALADDDYVRRSGEDEYGPTYEKVDTVPDEMSEILDEDGNFVVPIFY